MIESNCGPVWFLAPPQAELRVIGSPAVDVFKWAGLAVAPLQVAMAGRALAVDDSGQLRMSTVLAVTHGTGAIFNLHGVMDWSVVAFRAGLVFYGRHAGVGRQKATDRFKAIRMAQMTIVIEQCMSIGQGAGLINAPVVQELGCQRPGETGHQHSTNEDPFAILAPSPAQEMIA